MNKKKKYTYYGGNTHIMKNRYPFSIKQLTTKNQKY